LIEQTRVFIRKSRNRTKLLLDRPLKEKEKINEKYI